MKHAFRIRILPLILLLFLAETLFSQTFSLSGKVTDERNRQPLAFVNVVINDGQHGVISDIDGRYAISLDEPIMKVKFSSIGYEPKEITLQANQKKCNIALTPKTFELGEVTVEAGENPARRIGADRKGRIVPGSDADLVLLDDCIAGFKEHRLENPKENQHNRRKEDKVYRELIPQRQEPPSAKLSSFQSDNLPLGALQYICCSRRATFSKA